jgi:hypothetical protein
METNAFLKQAEREARFVDALMPARYALAIYHGVTVIGDDECGSAWPLASATSYANSMQFCRWPESIQLNPFVRLACRMSARAKMMHRMPRSSEMARWSLHARRESAQRESRPMKCSRRTP